MKFITFFIFSFLLFSKITLASPLPCTIWQTQAKAHPVKPYKNKNGTHIIKSETDEHCRLKYPKTEKWQTQFFDGVFSGWPMPDEKFKNWTQSEKELVLKFLSGQPQALRALNDIKLLRVSKSKFKNNPGAAVKALNAIALYDNFFSSEEKSRILSHELSHLYLYNLNQEKLANLVSELGWRQEVKENSLIRLPNYLLLKPDSAQSITEDIANHLEDFLHDRENLRKNFPDRYKLIQETVPADFKLENP
jgi:hypothetical protein